jgi:hypothetical protein
MIWNNANGGLENVFKEVRKPKFVWNCVICGKEITPEMNVLTCKSKECRIRYQQFRQEYKRINDIGDYKKKASKYNKWRVNMLKKYNVKRLEEINKKIRKMETKLWKDKKNGNV